MLLHTRGAWGLPPDWGDPFNFAMGVSFFFVLSGFILTHAYPRLDEAGARRFFVARLARLWPVHVVTFLLVVLPSALGAWSHPPSDTVMTAVANLALLHAWVPYPDSYFSFNAPSWSISTELGFYLLFPLLIWEWRRTWHVKLALAWLSLWGMSLLAATLGLPISQPGLPGPDATGISVNPLSTVCMFVLGMAACLAWQAVAPRLRVGVVVGTLLELSALAGAAWSGAVTTNLVAVLASLLGLRTDGWLPIVPSQAVTFPLLIVAMALGRGLLSRALAWAPCVLLGEISYAMYLVHAPLKVYLTVLADGGVGPVWWAIFWLSSIGAAWLLWRFVERPSRSGLRGAFARHEHRLTARQWRMVGVGIGAAMAAVLVVHVVMLR